VRDQARGRGNAVAWGARGSKASRRATAKHGLRPEGRCTCEQELATTAAMMWRPAVARKGRGARGEGQQGRGIGPRQGEDDAWK
jgi:hypothetical protein